MNYAFEELLGFHCGPALAGIKPANLVSVSKDEYPELHRLTEEYGQILHKTGLRLRLVCSCGRRMLLLVYREAKLRAQLEDPEISAILAEAGYPDDFEGRLAHLEHRLRQGDFPHEIGAFLGYPAGDIRGFQRDKGKGCLYSGLWKVYSDVDSAIARFDRYERCRDCICRHLKGGRTLTQMFCAA